MADHEVRDERVDGLDGLALLSHARDLRVAFAPAAGMVAYSLTHRGEELLGLRGGLTAYRQRGSSFGIPLLHPWANRLEGLSYAVGGRSVELDGDAPLHLDANGLPIHGLVAASPYWRETGRTPGNGSAAIGARLDYAAHEDLMSAFPFPHELHVEAELKDGTLRIGTILLPTGDVAVPVAFGWHPYLRLPGARAPSGGSSCRCAAAPSSTSAACPPGASPSRSSPARSVSVPTTTTSSSSSARRCSRSRAAGAGSSWSSATATRSHRSTRRFRPATSPTSASSR